MADNNAKTYRQPSRPNPAFGSPDVGGGQRESDLPVGQPEPARRAFINAGYSRPEQLIRLSETEVKGLHGVGPKALGQLRHALEANNQSFAEGKTAS